jgi:hypothetical protein
VLNGLQVKNKYTGKERWPSTKKIVILFPDKCFVSVTSGARNKHAISTKCIFYEETTKYFCKSICSVKNILKHIQRGNNFQSQRIAKVHSGR